jgi:ribonuclease HII
MVIGIDEVGRGCWAGPLVAAAVSLRQPIPGLKDSKQLTKLQRKKLSEQIKASALYGLGWVYPKDIDRLGLTKATQLAMQQAISQIETQNVEIIIDGTINYLPNYQNVTVLAKADSLIAEVSAASILAKVARDEYMASMSEQFPLYQFEKHVGYGTALHIAMLKLHGVCELHRLSYKPIVKIMAY